MTRHRPFVIGAGPAGTAAAIRLAEANARPIIYERRQTVGSAPCGGFLSWATLDRLEQLGLPRSALGGHDVHTLRLSTGRREWELPLPRPAMGLSRERLDSLMLTRSQSLGAEVRRGTVLFQEGKFHVKDGPALDADSIFLATGKYDVHGLMRGHEETSHDPFLGLRTGFEAGEAMLETLSGNIEMHLFDRGYAGLVLHEDGRANLSIALRKSRLVQAGGSLQTLLSQLAKGDGPLSCRLEALPADARTDAIGLVPYGWCAVATQPGLFRLGDQAGVIPSLAGEGIGIALASAMLATDAWLSDGPAGSCRFQRDFAARLRPRLLLAGAVSDLATHPALAPWLGASASLPGIARLVAALTRI